MSISDVLWESIHKIITRYILDEFGHRSEVWNDCYDDAWVAHRLMPVLTAMNDLLHQLDMPPGVTDHGPLYCAQHREPFADVIALWKHFYFSGQHQSTVATMAMQRAGTREDTPIVRRHDEPMDIREVDMEVIPGATVSEAERFVITVADGCLVCQGIRAEFLRHMHGSHPNT